VSAASPQVSRRLARRLGADLRRGRWGSALLAAKAYEALLDGLRPADTALLARELIVQLVVSSRRLHVLVPRSCVSNLPIHRWRGCSTCR